MPSSGRRLVALLLLSASLAACGGVLKKQYEYEEEIYLSLDGSATVNVNTSVAALVALRGVDLDVEPRARLDRARIREFFAGPGVTVTRVGDSRRDRRRFVHVTVQVDDLRQLPRTAPFAWSKYQFGRRGEVLEYRQVVGESAAQPVGDVGWDGEELVAFRIHIPSEIPFHNSARPPQRGNILEWEQPLSARLEGMPLELHVTMEPESILYTTLLLFGSTVVAAAMAFAVVIWLIVRRGRNAAVAESTS
jgi:hypothetical protein